MPLGIPGYEQHLHTTVLEVTVETGRARGRSNKKIGIEGKMGKMDKWKE